MNNMIITRGFPASGKTTWASSWVAENPDNRVNINRDDLRAVVGCVPIGDKNQEDMVTSMSQAMLDSALKQGKDIVVSNTNLKASLVKDLLVQGIKAGYTVSVKDFIVDIDELVARDAVREDSVGASVIHKMNKRFPYKNWVPESVLIEQATNKAHGVKFAPLNNDPSLPPAVICDMDGTLAHMNGRSPYDFMSAGEDTLNKPVASTIKALHDAGNTIIIFSGREDVCRNITEKWLDDNGIPWDALYMRASGDKRKDDIVKYEMIVNNIVDKHHITCWMDDRNQVVDMVRKVFPNEPTLCFQVNYGDF